MNNTFNSELLEDTIKHLTPFEKNKYFFNPEFRINKGFHLTILIYNGTSELGETKVEIKTLTDKDGLIYLSNNKNEALTVCSTLNRILLGKTSTEYFKILDLLYKFGYTHLNPNS